MSDFGTLHTKPRQLEESLRKSIREGEKNTLFTREFRKINEEKQWKEVTPRQSFGLYERSIKCRQ